MVPRGGKREIISLLTSNNSFNAIPYKLTHCLSVLGTALRRFPYISTDAAVAVIAGCVAGRDVNGAEASGRLVTFPS